MEGFFQTKQNRILASLALLMLVLALGMYARLAWKQAEYMHQGPVTISVAGEGEVNAVPDIGQFTYMVTRKGEDASAARNQAAEVTIAIATYLKSAGVDEKDIKTENYTLSPKYRFEQKPCPLGTYCPGENVPDGFEVTESVRVKIRNLSQAGELIGGVSERGATNVSDLSFTIDDTKALEAEARGLAIAEAKVKAEELAKQLGVRLVKFVGYYEDNGQYPRYGYGGEMAVDMVKAPTATNPEPQLGERTVKSRVTVTYQVR